MPESEENYIVEWRYLVKAKSPKEAAEIAAAIIFDQSQENLTLRVRSQEIELINGVAHTDQVKLQQTNI